MASAHPAVAEAPQRQMALRSVVRSDSMKSTFRFGAIGIAALLPSNWAVFVLSEQAGY
jgi:hypothetical protein